MWVWGGGGGLYREKQKGKEGGKGKDSMGWHGMGPGIRKGGFSFGGTIGGMDIVSGKSMKHQM